MFLAITVLLLHASAAPQAAVAAASASAASSDAVSLSQATTPQTVSASAPLDSANTTQNATRLSAENSAEGTFNWSRTFSSRASDFAPDSSNPALDRDPNHEVALLPGRLTPQRAPAPRHSLAVYELPLPEPAFISMAPSPSAAAALLQFRAEQRELQHRRREWLALAIAAHSAAAFDAFATRDAITNAGGHEINPTLRPFAGNASLYAAIQVGPALLDFAGRRMMSSHREWMRNKWWVPQIAGAAMSLISGAHNLSIR